MLAEANAMVETISVPDAQALVGDLDVVFVDVRETVERLTTGNIKDSVHMPRGFLEFIADPEGPMHIDSLASGRRLVLYCGTGSRSALAAKTLIDMGLENVCHIAGGYGAWVEAGGPTDS
jgi:rhodanese-related sulfurtransferase